MKITLDRRIALQRNVVSVDDGGTPINQPVQVQEVWAQYKPLNSQESYPNDRELAQADAEFTIRYSSEVLWLKSAHCLSFDGRIYELISDPTEVVRREYLSFKARVRDTNNA